MDNGLEFLSRSPALSRTLSDQVANQLRQAILEGRLKPGQRIVEQDIAEAMEMSRGPVRDALKILQNERLVVRHPHRGAFVARLTLRDAEEIYSLREALETLAVEYAIKFATDEQFGKLESIVDAMVAQSDRDYTQLQATDLDLEFHGMLCQISGHSRMLAAWKALRAQVRLLILTHRIQQPMDFRQRGAKWHRELLDALRQRDLQVAKQVLRTHLAVSFESAVQAIKHSENELTAHDESG